MTVLQCPAMARSKRLKATRSVAEYARWFASQGGKARTHAMTPKERSEAASKAVSARWRKTSPEQRRKIARKAARARWAKTKRAESKAR